MTIPEGLTDRASPRYMDGMFGTWKIGMHTAKTKALEEAHRATCEAWKRIHKRNKALAADPTKNEASRLLSSAVHAQKLMGEARDKFESAMASAKERRAEIDEIATLVAREDQDEAAA